MTMLKSAQAELSVGVISLPGQVVGDGFKSRLDSVRKSTDAWCKKLSMWRGDLASRIVQLTRQPLNEDLSYKRAIILCFLYCVST